MTTPTIAARLLAAQEHFRAGRLDDAAAVLNEVLAADPDHGEALQGLGYVMAQRGDHARAADCLERALTRRPPSRELLHQTGCVQQIAGRHAQAVVSFERCVALAPRDVASLHAAALSLNALTRHAAALAMLDRAARLSPDTFQIHYNRGRVLGDIGRFDEEIAAYRRALALRPDFVDAHVNLGVAWRDMHRFDEALRAFRKAVSLAPHDADARTNRAQTNLLLGEFEHGWREYEWRWRDGRQAHPFAGKAWLGETPVAGRTVLVHAEQGFGDTLQFVRYVPLLAAAGARVVLRVQDALLPLLSGMPGAAVVVGESEAVPGWDLHCPLLSLPLAFGTRAATIPTTAPYLRADAGKIARWHSLLDGLSGPGRARVGLVWSGRATHPNDRNRSIPLQALQPLLAADADFISLQQDVRDSDRAALAAHPGVRDVSALLRGFDDTAALVASLDLVITVDTAVAHLSGALARPVWIALPHTPDWRWQLGRCDSPWYPSARLFRQTRRGDWNDAIGALRGALDAWLAARPPREPVSPAHRS
jgi:tetratricopeptide (TPR) repeat protein